MKISFNFIRDMSIVIIAVSIITFIIGTGLRKMINHSDNYGRLLAIEDQYNEIKKDYKKLEDRKENLINFAMFVKINYPNIYEEARLKLNDNQSKWSDNNGYEAR